jgi:hypothetical protein
MCMNNISFSNVKAGVTRKGRSYTNVASLLIVIFGYLFKYSFYKHFYLFIWYNYFLSMRLYSIYWHILSLKLLIDIFLVSTFFSYSYVGMKTVRIFSDRIRDRIRLEGFICPYPSSDIQYPIPYPYPYPYPNTEIAYLWCRYPIGSYPA